MKAQIVNDQNKLIELIQSQGWNITALELTEYGSGFAGDVIYYGSSVTKRRMRADDVQLDYSVVVSVHGQTTE